MIGKALDPISRPTRKSMRSLFRDDVEGEDIILVQRMLPKRPQNEQVSVLKSTATKRQALQTTESKKRMKKKIN